MHKHRLFNIINCYVRALATYVSLCLCWFFVSVCVCLSVCLTAYLSFCRCFMDSLSLLYPNRMGFYLIVPWSDISLNNPYESKKITFHDLQGGYWVYKVKQRFQGKIYSQKIR